MKKKVLFICTHNSARSQMAEGLANHYLSNLLEASSAGTEATSVNPFAIEALRIIGIDITGQYSKSIDEFKNIIFDIVVTVCDSAREKCPFFPGKKVIHKSFFDPSSVEGDYNEKLNAFIKVRDEILNWLKSDFIKEIDI